MAWTDGRVLQPRRLAKKRKEVFLQVGSLGRLDLERMNVLVDHDFPRTLARMEVRRCHGMQRPLEGLGRLGVGRRPRGCRVVARGLRKRHVRLWSGTEWLLTGSSAAWRKLKSNGVSVASGKDGPSAFCGRRGSMYCPGPL